MKKLGFMNTHATTALVFVFAMLVASPALARYHHGNFTSRVNGTCGASSGQTLSAAPTSDLCDTGTATNVSEGRRHYRWICDGTGGGSNARCSATIDTTVTTTVPVNGTCGSANGQTFSAAPTTNLCGSNSAASTVTGSGPWSWSCAGTNDGAAVQCTASLQEATTTTACGTHTSGSTYTLTTSSTSGTTTATTAQCPNGGTVPTLTVVTQQYTCTNGTQTAKGSPVSTVTTATPVCKTTPPTAAACGAHASGSTYTLTTTTSGSITATTAQCANGGTVPTTTTTTQSYICTNGTQTASGSPTTSTTNGTPTCLLAPAGASCTGGYASGSTYTLTTSSTTGSRTATATECPGGGTVATMTTTTQKYTCTNGTQTASGTPSTTTIDGGAPVCTATAVKPVNGTCGTANGQTTAPTTNLCATGTASAVSGNGPWTWTCSGTIGGTEVGTTALCSASSGGMAVTVDFAAPTSNMVPGSLWGWGSGDLLDNSFKNSSDPVFEATAAVLDFQLLRWNVSSGAAEGDWEDAIFANGVNNPNWSYLDPWFTLSPTFWNKSHPMVVGIGPANGNKVRSASDWAAMATTMASHFKSKGQEVFYWEVGNEPDGPVDINYYISSFNAIAQALHAFNPAYKVGGPVTTWGNGAYITPWAQQCGTNADFTDWHSYPVNTYDDDATMYQKGIAGDVSGVLSAIAGTPMASKPLGLLEYNMHGDYTTAEPRQQTYEDAVYTALRLTESFKQTPLFQMSAIWDILYDSYGVIGFEGSPYTNVAPVGYYLGYAGQFMPGTEVPSTVSSSVNIKSFATINGDKFAIQLVNYDTAQTYGIAVNITPPAGKSIANADTWEIGSTTGSNFVTGSTMPGATMSIPPATVVIITGTFD